MPNSTNPTNSEALNHTTLHKFLRINRYLRKHARQIGSHGLKPKQLSVLFFLAEKKQATVGDIQEYLYCSPSMASTLIAKLEKKGYLVRTRSPDDNRVVIVQLTEAGEALAQTIPMGGIALLRRRLPDISPEKVQLLDEAFSTLLTLMEVPEDE